MIQTTSMTLAQYAASTRLARIPADIQDLSPLDERQLASGAELINAVVPA